MTNYSSNGSQPLKTIKVVGSLCKAAKAQKLDSPQRLWWLARAVDDGSGRVSHKALMEQATRFITKSDRSQRKMLQDCKAQGWLKECKSKDGVCHYIVHSLERMATALDTQCTQPATVYASELKSIKKWRVACWDATMAGRKGYRARPVARKTLERLTGVDTRSQQRYEKDSKRIKSQKNIAVAYVSKSLVEGMKEVKDKPAFPVGDHVGWQLPNSYDVDITLNAKGRTTKINKKLRHSKVVHKDMPPNKRERKYYHRESDAERAMRQEEHPEEVYTSTERYTEHMSSPKRIWAHKE